MKDVCRYVPDCWDFGPPMLYSPEGWLSLVLSCLLGLTISAWHPDDVAMCLREVNTPRTHVDIFTCFERVEYRELKKSNEFVSQELHSLCTYTPPYIQPSMTALDPASLPSRGKSSPIK